MSTNKTSAHSPEPSAFAVAFRRRIAELSLSQAEVASRTGIDKSEISRLATGRRQPRAQEVVALCRVLGVTPKELGLGDDYTIDDPKASVAVEEATKRMLAIESESAELKARIDVLERQLAEERAASRERERKLETRLTDLKMHHASELAQREQEFALELRAAHDAERRAQDDNAMLRTRNRLLEAALKAQQGECGRLQQQLASEEGRRATAMVATGLATFFVTAAIASKE